MSRALLIAVAILVPAAAAAASSSIGGPALRAAMLYAHNQAREQLAAGPLAWDEQLARDASAYAATLARTGRFQHAAQDAKLPYQGENLWMGRRGAFSFAAMVEPLIAERRYFRPGAFPAVSSTGQWSDVGHYTQIVWPTTQRVGCAVASSPSNDYLVCRYFPAGNVYGVELR